MKSTLEQLKDFSIIVADTSDLESIKIFRPRDATTNPSLILRAAQQEQYQEILNKAISDTREQPLASIINNIIVNFGTEILKIIDGRVSSEVDARYSFGTSQTIECAQNIIKLYEQNGIDRARVLIKIPGTWEGILAAKFLEEQDICCNLTLIFSLEQAIVCGNSRVTLISPFVGRILDWYKKNNSQNDYSEQDPGVQSVKRIFNYYKSHDINTEIMGASFRNVNQILSLSGCDLLTISPKLLEELKNSNQDVSRQLNADVLNISEQEIFLDEEKFRFALNENAMATEKLAEGIRLFAEDTRKLENIVRQKCD